MKCLAYLVFAFGLLPLTFAAFDQQPDTTDSAPDSSEDVESIKKWIDQYCAAVTAGDIEAYRAFWTEDVVWLPPHTSVRSGIESCMEHNRKYFEQYNSVEKMSVDEIEIADRFAFVRVSYTCQGEPKAESEGEPFVEDGKGIFILKRKPDGSWVSTHCVWNSNIALPEDA